MIDHQELKICLREELGKLGVAETEEDRLVTELNVLACILIEAAQSSSHTSSEAKIAVR
jgi:hypothetical protein